MIHIVLSLRDEARYVNACVSGIDSREPRNMELDGSQINQHGSGEALTEFPYTTPTAYIFALPCSRCRVIAIFSKMH